MSRLSSLTVVAAAALLTSACTSLGGFGGGRGPTPLVAVPTTPVAAQSLPPPAPVTPPPEEAKPEEVAAAPAEPTPEETAAKEAQAASQARDVTMNEMVGGWTLSSGGSSCQLFMSTTNWSGGRRASTRGCKGDLANVSAWSLSGRQIALKNSDGGTIATLYGSASGGFNGSAGGQAVSVYR